MKLPYDMKNFLEILAAFCLQKENHNNLKAAVLDVDITV